MEQKILYLGDTALDQAASYLAGILNYNQVNFDYLSSDRKFMGDLSTSEVKAVVISIKET